MVAYRYIFDEFDADTDILGVTTEDLLANSGKEDTHTTGKNRSLGFVNSLPMA